MCKENFLIYFIHLRKCSYLNIPSYTVNYSKKTGYHSVTNRSIVPICILYNIQCENLFFWKSICTSPLYFAKWTNHLSFRTSAYVKKIYLMRYCTTFVYSGIINKGSTSNLQYANNFQYRNSWDFLIFFSPKKAFLDHAL